jgi:PAS domain S-box-containing protein
MAERQSVSEDRSLGEAADFLRGGGKMGELMRALDWSRTALGPVTRWPQSLKTAVSIMLNSRYAMFVWWGRPLTNLYNDAYRPFLGEKHPLALGQSARDVWSEIWGLIGPRTEAVLECGESTFDEALLLIMERYGYPEETYFTFSYSPIRDDRGQVGGIFCAVTDETSRVIGERRLKLLREVAASASETHTPKQVCAAAAGCISGDAYDLPFALLYLSEGGGRRARLVARSGIDAAHPAARSVVELDEPAAIWPFAEAKEKGEPLVVEDLQSRFERLPTGAWDRPPTRAVVIPFAEQGQTSLAGFLVAGLNPYLLYDEGYRGFVGLLAGQIAAGIANARAYEEEHRRAEALAEIDRAKTAFFSNVSHEFRTPLTLMLGPLEDLLAKPGGSAGDSALAATAHRNGLRLLKLVNSLLDFSRIEAGRVQASYEPTDLGALTAELASNFRSACEKAGLSLAVDCPTLPERVYVDRDMWEKIVLNLVSNAFKYTLAGGIEVRLRQRDGAAILSVRDTGCGIPENEIPQLFERFHRIEGAQGRTHEGTGIGLALVQELVKLHAGRVWIESARGVGSTFAVSLPLGTAHLPPDRIRAARTLSSTTIGAIAYVEEALRWLPGEQGIARRENTVEREILAEQPSLTPAVSIASDERRIILLADDNADMRDYLGRLLGAQYEVKAVANGSEALTALHEGNRPDLLLSDVMMPGLDGFGLLRAVRADPALTDLPVILLTARAGEEASAEGIEAGADDYLVKPFSARELLARIAANLEKSRLRRHSRRAEESARVAEERLRAALLASGTGTFRWDIGTRTVEADEALDRLFGLPPSGTATRRIDEFLARVHPEDRAGVMERVERCIEEGVDFEIEFRVRGPIGSPAWLYARSKMFLAADGHPAYMAGACVDITARKCAEAELQRLNVRLEQLVEERTSDLADANARLRLEKSLCERLIESSLSGIVALDREYRYTIFNPAMEQMTGIPRAQVLGQVVFEVFPFIKGTPAEAAWRRAIDREEASSAFDLRYAVPETGREGSYEAFYSPLYGSGRECIGALAVVRETTERQRMEEAVRQSQRLEAIAQLTGGVAHDFNNLLMVIGGNIELLKHRRGKMDRIVGVVEDAVARGQSLTRQLLSFSRRQPLQPQVLDLSALAPKLIELLRASLRGDIEIVTDIAEDVWPVKVDLAELELALLNIAVNARDAMPKGGRLSLGVRNERLIRGPVSAGGSIGDFVRIAVTDTGTGIPADVLGKVFEPFFTTKDVGKGTGLGLSQVHGFITQSGGEIAITSAEGEGTTVSLLLPRSTAPLLPPELETAAQVTPPASGIVLLVEDNEEVAEVTTAMLESLGFVVRRAPSAQRALKYLESGEHLDLVLTDIVMPGGTNGIEVARTIRECYPHLPILLTTGYSTVAHEAVGEGFILLSKPFRVSVLEKIIRNALDHNTPISSKPAEATLPGRARTPTAS